MRRSYLLAGALSLALSAIPAASFGAVGPERPPALCPLSQAGSLPALDPSAKAVTSFCTANCSNGTTVTCTGTECFAVDYICPGQQGYCWGTQSETKSCPPCMVCKTNQPCTRDADCGTCFGLPCVCREATTSLSESVGTSDVPGPKLLCYCF